MSENVEKINKQDFPIIDKCVENNYRKAAESYHDSGRESCIYRDGFRECCDYCEYLPYYKKRNFR